MAWPELCWRECRTEGRERVWESWKHAEYFYRLFIWGFASLQLHWYGCHSLHLNGPNCFQFNSYKPLRPIFRLSARLPDLWPELYIWVYLLMYYTQSCTLSKNTIQVTYSWMSFGTLHIHGNFHFTFIIIALA